MATTESYKPLLPHTESTANNATVAKVMQYAKQDKTTAEQVMPRVREAQDEALAVKLQQEELNAAGGSSVGDHELAAALQSHMDSFSQGHHSGANSLSSSYDEDDEFTEDPLKQSLIYPELSAQAGHTSSVTSEWLERLPSVKIAPRVNSGIIPPADAAAQNRENIIERLQTFDLMEKVVTGDGACQFRALSDQLFGTPNYHDVVRKKVVEQLQKRPDKYSSYVPTDYAAYCKEMSQPSTWGDHVTLQAAADVYGSRITIITSFQENAVIKIEPEVQKNDHILYLSFWAEVHYNSIYSRQDPPRPEPPVPPPKQQRQRRFLGSKRLGRLVNHALVGPM